MKSRTPADKETLIYALFRYQGKRLKYSTGLSIKPKFWDDKKQLGKSLRNFNPATLNKSLTKISDIIVDIYNDDQSIPITQFKDEIDQKRGNNLIISSNTTNSEFFDFSKQPPS